MEATGNYHVQLASYLFECNCLVSVLNPLVIKRFSQMRLIRAKTDRKDVVMIYNYGEIEELKQSKAPQQYIVELKQLFTSINLMIKHRTGYKNQLEGYAQLKYNNNKNNSAIELQVVQLRNWKLRQKI
jgi:transposase